MGTQFNEFIIIYIFLSINKEKYPFIYVNLEQTRVLSTLYDGFDVLSFSISWNNFSLNDDMGYDMHHLIGRNIIRRLFIQTTVYESTTEYCST